MRSEKLGFIKKYRFLHTRQNAELAKQSALFNEFSSLITLLLGYAQQ